MNHATLLKRSLFVGAALWAGIFLFHKPVRADPSKYPQFAQQKLPDNITPAFVSVDQLAKEITAGGKPLIIDVRSAEEYREVHILGAVSSPLSEFSAHLENIPRDRPVVLY
jgi:3-mercaptopyruvate sulfurtransferase SseA